MSNNHDNNALPEPPPPAISNQKVISDTESCAKDKKEENTAQNEQEIPLVDAADVANAETETTTNTAPTEPQQNANIPPPNVHTPSEYSYTAGMSPQQPVFFPGSPAGGVGGVPGMLAPLPPTPSMMDSLLAADPSYSHHHQHHPAMAVQYYEARMRDHAAAYASAAAGAAWAAAQMAAVAAEFAAGNGPPPPVPYMMYASPTNAFWDSHQQHHIQQQQQQQHQYAQSYGQANYLPKSPAAAAQPPLQPPVHSPNTVAAAVAAATGANDKATPESSKAVDDQKHEEEEEFTQTQHRRKRHQHDVPRTITAPAQQRGKIRRRLRSDGDSGSSTSSSSCWHHRHKAGGSNSSSMSDGRRRRRGRSQQQQQQHKKARSDESLLGKTAVAALYEWCSRRNRLPSFVLQPSRDSSFECTVYLDDDETVVWGRGRGRNKGAAKQEAARRALQALCPGVEFDDTSDFVISIPQSLSNSNSSQAWEDLAPNLAKQLAIGGPVKRALPASEEEDAGYYATSQGASVLSDLLFTTVQIDPRTPEPPTFSYQMAPVVVAAQQQSRGAGVGRGRFTCTARLDLFENDGKKRLESEGVGASKRESRHIACARLLALLFPECRSMVQVKQAAETARTKYTETKAVLRSNSRRSTQDPFDPSAFAEQNDPPLPLVLKEGIRNLILDKEDLNMAAASDEKTAASLAIRQLSRKKQLDALVEKALQNVNERDEEGRSLPEELTADDVGRTLLRRAEPSDMRAIKKLLAEETPESSGRRSHSWETDFSGSEEEPFFNMSCVWSPTSIVLLLCRAIAAYEDPPLGCAVLTVDFSMEEGRILRAARIANEPHLPQERFIECLQDFAESLNYKLETTVRSDDKAKRWRVADAKSIVKSYVSEKSECKPRSIHQGTLPLQSVQEESEASDSSNAERRPAKSRSKPSKRSRFQ